MARNPSPPSILYLPSSILAPGTGCGRTRTCEAPKGDGVTGRCNRRSATHPGGGSAECWVLRKKTDDATGPGPRSPSSILDPPSSNFFPQHSALSTQHFLPPSPSYGTRTRSNTSTGCHADPYTNERFHTSIHKRGGLGNRTLTATFTVSHAAVTTRPPSLLRERAPSPRTAGLLRPRRRTLPGTKRKNPGACGAPGS
ncbi:MAG: hypothetical protein JWN24_3329 [Phycisphaerales bacterium]|nr:hypothetical protein [Phycisphaerales bacterium]